MPSGVVGTLGPASSDRERGSKRLLLRQGRRLLCAARGAHRPSDARSDQAAGVRTTRGRHGRRGEPAFPCAGVRAAPAAAPGQGVSLAGYPRFKASRPLRQARSEVALRAREKTSSAPEAPRCTTSRGARADRHGSPQLAFGIAQEKLIEPDTVPMICSETCSPSSTRATSRERSASQRGSATGRPGRGSVDRLHPLHGTGGGETGVAGVGLWLACVLLPRCQVGNGQIGAGGIFRSWSWWRVSGWFQGSWSGYRRGLGGR